MALVVQVFREGNSGLRKEGPKLIGHNRSLGHFSPTLRTIIGKYLRRISKQGCYQFAQVLALCRRRWKRQVDSPMNALF
jgi:hypothetical protein